MHTDSVDNGIKDTIHISLQDRNIILLNGERRQLILRQKTVLISVEKMKLLRCARNDPPAHFVLWRAGPSTSSGQAGKKKNPP